MIYVVTINNKVYEVEVEKGKANLLQTTEVAPAKPADIAQQPSAVRTVDAAQAVPAVNAAPTVATEGHVVRAPMPGTILDIKVQVGKRVKKGDILLILEAMKMENEIMAPVDGLIVQVIVAKGSSVTTGDSLVTLQ